MSQYATREIGSLKKDASIICKNLAPLLGCKAEGQGWAPFTGHTVCSTLLVTGTSCSNVADNKISNDVLSYRFNSSVTTEAGAIWRKVLAYNSEVLNSSYTMYIANQTPKGAQMEEKLHLTTKYCRYTDSTIFDAVFENNRIALTPQYQQICHILLSCFTIRYFLFEYTNGNGELNTLEVNESIIKKIVGNIDYVKFVLGQDKSVTIAYNKSPNYVSQHLTTLKKNLLMIEPNILQYLR